ncbi:Uncharacterized protein dnm_069390 [Desulfonema magnum]|uniref:Uncharacterized protein n=1 Tax=Desulfonema magnum TaxID=45655 RepID=A0A975BSF4_9BACT|nr:Uncharacterized protein dnm_069390 [Desulfonema magnum]
MSSDFDKLSRAVGRNDRLSGRIGSKNLIIGFKMVITPPSVNQKRVLLI